MNASPPLKEALLVPRPLTPRQRDRRERIQAATFSLLATHGGEALSMKMIAQAAGVAERTLFNIYGSKDGLFASSARERTEETARDAQRAAQALPDDGGMSFFHALPGALADKTFEAPALARAFAPILVAHGGLVGLPEIFEEYAGEALHRMRASGLIRGDHIALLPRLICMSTVSTIILWAKYEIADDALETHLFLGTFQLLLPHAEPKLAGMLRGEIDRCMATLARIEMPA